MDSDLQGLVDHESLERYLNDRLPGHPGPITVLKHTAGYSNVTLFVDRGDEQWVLRRPPTGDLLPTAHDVVREYRFISAVYGRARVPSPVLACEDLGVIGAPFYIMERVQGTEIRETVPLPYDDPAGRRKVAEEMIEALVELHSIDWRDVGLGAPPGSYAGRQLSRWQRQWNLTRPRTRDLPGLERASQWLQDHLPEERETAIVHGDYKLDNVLFSLEVPQLRAILDWELASIGDPLADLGWLLATWADRGATADSTEKGSTPQQPPPVSLAEGFPDREELCSMYAKRSGRDVGDVPFYVLLAMFKGTVIGEGIYMRYREGNVTNPQGARMEWEVPARIERMLQMLD
jgi:aminoglycoside phosphotransferase (APT) family kinase protein